MPTRLAAGIDAALAKAAPPKVALAKITGPDSVPRNSLGIAAGVGVLLLVLAWLVGPGLFGTAEAQEGTKTEATVTAPALCSASAPKESVRFEIGGKGQDGLLDACGHDRDERVNILVPLNSSSKDGVVAVSSAKVIEGHSDALRPMGLLLLAASCAVGGVYAFLFLRGPRRPASQ